MFILFKIDQTMSTILSNLPEVVSKEIKFIVGDYQCTVSYIEDPVDDCNKLLVELVHQTSFLAWGGQFDYEKINNVKNTSKLLDLTPEMVFNMFGDYSKGTLDESVIFKFPTKCKSPTESAYIEITLIASIHKGNTVEDSRMIILAPKEIGFEDRNDKKIEQVHSVVDLKIKTINNGLESKILNLETENKALLSCLHTLTGETQRLANLVTSSQDNIRKLNEMIDTLDKKVFSLSSDVNDLLPNIEKIGSDGGKIANLEISINGYATRENEIKSDIIDLKAQTITLESYMNTTAGRITTLEISQNRVSHWTGQTQTKIDKLESFVAELSKNEAPVSNPTL
jgi:hypothetical protein